MEKIIIKKLQSRQKIALVLLRIHELWQETSHPIVNLRISSFFFGFSIFFFKIVFFHGENDFIT